MIPFWLYSGGGAHMSEMEVDESASPDNDGGASGAENIENE